MWFPSFFQALSLTQRGRALFMLVIAIFVGVVIGVSQGPSPKAAAFDIRPADAGLTIAAPVRASIIGEAIPLPTQLPADSIAVNVATDVESVPVLATEAVARAIDGSVVVRDDTFAPDPSPPAALRMAAAFAGVDNFGAPPVPEQWPGFASLAGGSGTMIAGAESPLLIGDTEKPAATPPSDTPPESDVAPTEPGTDTDPSQHTSQPGAPAAAQPVPEPSSFLLMGFALLILGAITARRRYAAFAGACVRP